MTLEKLLDIPVEFWFVLSAMSPYLLFGFFVAGLLSVFISPELVERHLGRDSLGSIVKASLFGVPLPLCSCGVIPVAASLRRHGAGRGATTAFLISTPQTGVDSIFVTFSLLGPVFAIFRPIAAFVSGVIGGGFVALTSGGEDVATAEANRCTDACCVPGTDDGGKIRRMLRYGFITLPRDIGKSLLVGLIIAGLISALMPEDFFARHLGTGMPAILVLMLLGIPIYVCATASIPIAAALIVTGGVSPGAALAFLMTGPATNAAAIAIVYRIMGRRAAICYLLAVAVTAFAAGVLLDMLVEGSVVVDWVKLHQHTSVWVQVLQHVSAVVLLGVLAVAIFRPSLGRLGGTVPEDVAIAPAAVLSVEGMTCSHCAEAVTRALKEVTGVTSATVDLAAKRATVHGEAIDLDALCRAVTEVGYKANVLETEQNTLGKEEQDGQS